MLRVFSNYFNAYQRYLYPFFALIIIGSITWYILGSFSDFSNNVSKQMPETEYIIPINKDINSRLKSNNKTIETKNSNNYNKLVNIQNKKFSQEFNSKLDLETNKKELININSFKNQKAPLISIVIDDVGLNFKRLKKLLDIGDEPLTISFLPYGNNLKLQVDAAINDNHDILVHIPMEPYNNNKNPGPNSLDVGMNKNELIKYIQCNLTQVTDFVGVNNHMGSKFTSDKKSVENLMTELKKYNIIFLDSRTSSNSLAAEIAKKLEIFTLERDIFIDNNLSAKEIFEQLEKVENLAEKYGKVIAIGHLQNETIEALKIWMPIINKKGYKFVPISKMPNDNDKIFIKN